MIKFVVFKDEIVVEDVIVKNLKTRSFLRRGKISL